MLNETNIMVTRNIKSTCIKNRVTQIWSHAFLDTNLTMQERYINCDWNIILVIPFLDS